MVSQVPQKESQGHQKPQFSCEKVIHFSSLSCWNFNYDGHEGPAAGGEALKYIEENVTEHRISEHSIR